MAKRALGTTISINGTVIGGLTTITPPERTAETIDVTTLGSAGGYRDFIQGFKDGGEVEVEGFYDTVYTGQSELDTAYENGTEDTYLITFPAALGVVFSFTGIVTALSAPGEANIDDPLGFSATIKVKGKPELLKTNSTGLSALAISSGTLQPAFSNSIYEYNVTSTTSTVTVTPTAASHTITVTANGADQTVTSGAASSAMDIATGAITKIVINAKEATKIPKTYTINVYRA